METKGYLIETGMRGALVAELGNGFAEFRGDNGVTFTVHNTEFCADAATAGERSIAHQRVAGWPKGARRIAVERRSGQHAALVVQSLNSMPER